MAVEIEELAVLDPESGLSIFSDPDTRYTIPLYQREPIHGPMPRLSS